MKLFNEEKFYSIAEHVDDESTPSFVVLTNSGGYRKCATLVEASKFGTLENAKGAIKNHETLCIYEIETVTKTCLNKKNFHEMISWKPVD
jgi:hypothetical protein